jgi:hypothetical protein
MQREELHRVAVVFISKCLTKGCALRIGDVANPIFPKQGFLGHGNWSIYIVKHTVSDPNQGFLGQRPVANFPLGYMLIVYHNIRESMASVPSVYSGGHWFA